EQANADLAQAQEDAAQATRDMEQASIDAADAGVRMAEAQRAAAPTTLERWGREIETVAMAAAGLVGTVNLLSMAYTAVTASAVRSTAAAVASRVGTLAGAAATGVAAAAQWAGNIAMSVNPNGLLVIAIGGLRAAVVGIARQHAGCQD